MTKEQIWRVKDGLSRQKLYIALGCIESLEKENKTLKDREEGFKKQIIGLCEKYHQIYERFPELKDAFLQGDRIVQENEQLKEKIEKMKNHNNCKWFHEWNLADIMDEPLDDLSPCQGCKNKSKWELAE